MRRQQKTITGLTKRQEQTVFFILITVVGIALISSSLYLKNKDDRFLTYTNKKAKMSIRYPDDWVVVDAHPDLPQMVVAFRAPKDRALDDIQENVSIVIHDISEKVVSLEEYTKIAIDQMVGIFEEYIKVIDSSPTFMGKRKAHRFIWMGQDPMKAATRPIKMMHVWCIKGKTAYQFTYMAPVETFNIHLGDINEMLDSFRIRMF